MEPEEGDLNRIYELQDDIERCKQRIRDIDNLHNALFVEPMMAWAERQFGYDGEINWGPAVKALIAQADSAVAMRRALETLRSQVLDTGTPQHRAALYQFINRTLSDNPVLDFEGTTAIKP